MTDDHRERAAAAIVTLREAIDGLYARTLVITDDEDALIKAMERAMRQIADPDPEE